jgi:hypothetical protein
MMSREELLKQFPNIMALLEDDIDETRYLVVVDPNVEEEADEADVFDPTEYNWMVFFPERIKEALGEELFSKLPEMVKGLDIVEDFLDDDEDLFGILSQADEETITKRVLEVLDNLAKEVKDA